MNKIEIVKKLKDVKTKMKETKEDDYEEYLKLRQERLKLEAELNELKKTYYAGKEQAAKIKLRKQQDHYKFVLGGLVLRDNPDLIEKYGTKEKLEKLKFKIEDLTEKTYMDRKTYMEKLGKKEVEIVVNGEKLVKYV